MLVKAHVRVVVRASSRFLLGRAHDGGLRVQQRLGQRPERPHMNRN